MPFLRRSIPVFLLLLAFLLRVWQLAAIPPGLTHDEAGHGHDAAHILKGITLIYFTVGYGREPLFDYFNAGLIAGMGANPFTLRFSAVIWGMIALAATYRAARMMFGRETAALALTLMAVSFWPLATSRQILRSAMLPGEMALAVILFLKLTSKDAKGYWLLVIGLGAAIAASLYTYIPARILWLIFPLAVITSYVMRRANYQLPFTNYKSQFSNLQSLVSLPLAFLLASPLFIYLYQHPEAEQRLGMLSAPLTALQNGDPSLLFNNMKETLLALFLPGHGDHFLAYNIPGRPIYDPITALLALIGFLFLIWQLVNSKQLPVNSKQSLFTVHCLLLYWLLLGLAPALITGPEALTTRIIGAQPALYILPALGLTFVVSRLTKITGRMTYSVSRIAYCIFAVALLIITARDYFFTWAQSPDVRAAYQSTLIEMLKSINGPTVISTVYPSAAHDPYIGELITRQASRWVDVRYAVIVRAADDTAEPLQLLAPASTPIRPFLGKFYQQRIKVNLRSNDLDPYFVLYEPFPFRESQTATPLPVLSDAVELRGAGWLADSYQPGDVAELFTGWHVLDPTRLGPVHPPAFKTELNLFTHILNPGGSIFLQQDRLDAPSWQWQTGDTIIQIHQLAIPLTAAPGEYQVIVGLYDRITGERLLTENGADHVNVGLLIIR